MPAMASSQDDVERAPVPRATEVAYEMLCDAIIELQLVPGELVNERSLSERLGVSRLTLLQALHRAAETGLVSILPRRGILIAPVDIMSAQQVFEARSTLEPKLAELAAVRATAEDLVELRSLADEMEQLRQREDSSVEFPLLDRRLHLSIAHLAHNPFLEGSMQRVWRSNQRLWNVFFRQQGLQRDYLFDHGDIVSALERRDPEAARQAVLEHVASSRLLLQSRLWGQS